MDAFHPAQGGGQGGPFSGVQHGISGVQQQGDVHVFPFHVTEEVVQGAGGWCGGCVQKLDARADGSEKLVDLPDAGSQFRAGFPQKDHAFPRMAAQVFRTVLQPFLFPVCQGKGGSASFPGSRGGGFFLADIKVQFFQKGAQTRRRYGKAVVGMGSREGNAAFRRVKARAVPVVFLVIQPFRRAGRDEFPRVAIWVFMQEVAVQGQDASGAREPDAEADAVRQGRLHGAAGGGNGGVRVSADMGVLPPDFLQHGVQQGGVRGRQKDADAAAVPQIARPRGKSAAEFVFRRLLAVEENVPAASGIVKVQNGGLHRGRQAGAFRVLQGGQQLDGPAFITCRQHGPDASSQGQAGGVGRFHAGNGPFRPFVVGHQVFFHAAAGGQRQAHQGRSGPHPFHEGTAGHFPFFFRKKGGMVMRNIVPGEWRLRSQTGVGVDG
ncbi:hypothetical protein HMPREF3038_00208 [Akkermansia sp. KLE1797]|nr:hypothetical protein HMPREF3038_00208 [Akkermansia sp. KLE1797]KXU52776.1 hypothetical protein HMPREF3039_03063 [Akkermansia sp. KLE1798]KZA04539.1 hypothetical protein HMPREF1326_01784 [Akkermansia sp. KLE1605]